MSDQALKNHRRITTNLYIEATALDRLIARRPAKYDVEYNELLRISNSIHDLVFEMKRMRRNTR
jgi:hypothetical protein